MRELSYPNSHLTANSFATITTALAAIENLNIQRVYVPDLPDLTHTRLRATTVGNRPLYHSNWNRLQWELVDRFLQRRSETALRRLGLTDIMIGRKTDAQFVYNRFRNVSVRQCGANRVAANVARLAQALGLSVVVDYVHPRNRAKLEHLRIA